MRRGWPPPVVSGVVQSTASRGDNINIAGDNLYPIQGVLIGGNALTTDQYGGAPT